MKIVENATFNTQPAEKPEVLIIDAMVYLPALVNPPQTYLAIAERILRDLSPQSKTDPFCSRQVHITINQGCNTHLRGATMFIINVVGRDQVRPKDFQEALDSTELNEEFLSFLIEDCYAKHLQHHEFYATNTEVCHLYTSENGEAANAMVSPNLNCEHMEADTRIVFHLYKVLHDKDLCMYHVMKTRQK